MRQVGAGAVVVGPRFGQPLLPRVLEPAHIARRWHPVVIVAVDVERRAQAVGQGDHRAALVRQQPFRVRRSRSGVADDGPVQPQAGDVAAHQGARGRVILGRQLLARILEPRRGRAGRGGDQAAERVKGEAGRPRPARRRGRGRSPLRPF